MSFFSRIRAFYQLAKPGIIYGNLLTTVAAFLYASAWRGPWDTFAATALGLGLVIGSACVWNNYFDISIDAKMARTKNRPLVTGLISKNEARIYGTILGALGISLLIVWVNALTALLALVFGFFWYVAIYTPFKRRTHWGAVLGTVPGAVPMLVGYTAVLDRIDLPALLLFLSMVVWQLPHFYGIALYRFKDYTDAGIPILPARKGIQATKRHIIGAIVCFAILVISFTTLGHAGFVYFVLMFAVSCVWLLRALRGYRLETDATALWARGIFLLSLIVLLTFCVALAAAPLVL